MRYASFSEAVRGAMFNTGSRERQRARDVRGSLLEIKICNAAVGLLIRRNSGII